MIPKRRIGAGAIFLLVDTATTEFVTFQDPDSDFSTMDVRDVEGDIVRFDAAAQQLVWVADELAFDGWDINGTALADGFFTVRFGTEDGQRRAYFTETDPPTICNIVVTDGALSIFPTEVTVPQE
jgi:hypothetical protein